MNNQNKIDLPVKPFLSEPVSVDGKKFVLPQKLSKNNSQEYKQPWSGFEPPLTIDKTHSKHPTIQKSNIKTGNIFRGIELHGDEWMKMACNIAVDSVKNGGGPFGVVILQINSQSNSIIRYWTNYNQVTIINDPSAHAEVMAIRSACQSLGVFNLGEIKQKESKLTQPGETSHCVIYSSTEPCPMCYSAIHWAKIPMFLFASTRFDAATDGVNFSDEELYEEFSKAYPNRKIKAYQCTTDNSLDAFNFWKRSDKTTY